MISNFEKWKSELTPDSFIVLIGEDCDLCPAHRWCQDSSMARRPVGGWVSECHRRFSAWAGEEASS
jgi:hypothetical protein